MPWPTFREDLLQAEQVTVVVQVNGKVRSRIEVPADAAQDAVAAVALEDDKVAKFLAGKEPKRVIYVPGRLLNIVVA